MPDAKPNETNPEHPQAHPIVSDSDKAKRVIPSIVYEAGVAITAGWLIYMGTNDWKQGVGAALLTMFGGGVHRAGAWYTEK